jgi:hypothetical protein
MANPWLALDSGFMHDTRVVQLGCKHGPAGPLVWVVILAEAKRTNNNGEVEVTPESLARAAFLQDSNQVDLLLDELEKLGVVRVTARDAGVISLTVENWSKYQFDPRSRALQRERQARYRAKKRDGDAEVTARDAGVTPTETETETNTKTNSQVQEIFEHWVEVHKKPQAKLNTKRKQKIQARLREGYSTDDLKAAIEGCRASEFHMGANAEKKVYDDLALICRDGSQVEKFVDLNKEAPREEEWWQTLS